MYSENITILHYTAPPIIGGVEAVIEAHTKVFLNNGYTVTILTGRGGLNNPLENLKVEIIPEIDSLHPQISQISASLESGEPSPEFESVSKLLATRLISILNDSDHLIVHNIFTKHFNLPLTAALFSLLDNRTIKNCIAWCHDFTWTSPSSRSKVHPGYPWDLLRTYRSDVSYVTVSERRQQTLSKLFDCPIEKVNLVYNGVDPQELLGLSPDGFELINRIGLLDNELNLLLPVRVTGAKNIEFALRTLAVPKSNSVNAKLVITGPPDPHDNESIELFQSLKSLSNKLDIQEEVHFIYESGSDPKTPFYIKSKIVGDLYRVSDILFMPSHREGFGMPVLEAGLVGLAVFSTGFPAAEEIGGKDITTIYPGVDPQAAANQIMTWAANSKIYHLKRRVRQEFTWEAIFQDKIKPLFLCS